MGLIVAAALALGGCSLIPQKSGVEIMSYPVAKVYLDGKEAGMTPYKNSSLLPGSTEVRLLSQDGEWTRILDLKNNVNTVVDWELSKNDKLEGGYVLFLEKTGDSNKAGLLVNALPNKCAVAIDGEIKGYSPIRIEDINEGDRQVTISYPGYKSVNVFVKAIRGYQLVIDSKLAMEEVSITETPDVKEEIVDTLQTGKKVVIKETGTGWLRVRDGASNEATEIDRVSPGESFNLLEETEEWYKIELGDSDEGWISAKYAEISEE